MAPVKLPAEQRFVLSGIDWQTYLTFSDHLGERHVRLNYDRGNLEFMTTSFEHERAKKLLARLLEALTEEMAIELISGGSLTCRREDLERGFEPDECYWITRESRLLGRTTIDLATDPPPDLVLEVEISRSFLDRLTICASLGVPEVWRWDGQNLRVMIREAEGQYREVEHSQAFPFLPLADLPRFLKLGATLNDTKLLREFRAWVRAQMAHGWSHANS